jgi:hypothetical protein
MNLVLQQLSDDLKGPARSRFLAPEACAAFRLLEKDTDGLIYTDLWHDGTQSLLARRTRKTTNLPGYSPHNYGLALDLDLGQVLEQKKISYEDLLYVMKRRGWYSHRRDGKVDEAGSAHFNFLGDGDVDSYIELATFDPLSWERPIEKRIYEKHITDFSLSPAQIQSLLKKLGFFHGEVNGDYDIYFREAVMAFQRAWDLPDSGTPTTAFQRVLAFVAAEITILPG